MNGKCDGRIESTQDDDNYTIYRRRFAILATVLMLNISNATIWITYSSVATTVGNFYNVAPSKVNWFSLVYLIVSFPFTFIATFIVDKFGLKVGLNLGSGFNCIGAIIKSLGTSGLIDDSSTQFAVSLTGQIVSAMAQCFVLYTPTKVSQLWFPENHRAISTTVMAMSNPLGILIATAATPFIVNEDESKISLNNYIWGSLAIIVEILTLVSVTRPHPKTPPSRSAQKGNGNKEPYLKQLKESFTCLPYVLLFLTLGAGIGVFNAFATLAEQILCPIGYSDVGSSGTIVTMLFMGFIGAAISGIAADKTKKFTEITKIFFGCAAVFGALMFEFYLVPNLLWAVILFSGLFGLFGVGAYPIGLELAVEATYPVEETISSGFIFLSGQINGILIIALVPILATEQKVEDSELNECSSELDIEPKDYSIPMYVLMGYLVTLIVLMITFMKTRYKRLEAEIKKNHNTQSGMIINDPVLAVSGVSFTSTDRQHQVTKRPSIYTEHL